MEIRVDTARKVKELGNLFGIFFEDINHAADGGLYAELVQNGSFEFCHLDNKRYHHLTAWDISGCIPAIRTGSPAFHQNPHYLQVMVKPGQQAVIRNNGFAGMGVKAGDEYVFSCYARTHECFAGEMAVDLCGTRVAIPVPGREWTRITAKITVGSDTNAPPEPIRQESGNTNCLTILINGDGFADFDMVSLMPKDAIFGCLRKDIAESLKALKPKFMRFPGGCLVADGALDAHARNSMYRWKNTIGPREERPSRRNNWGYNQTLGLGFYEYFMLSEYLGAAPVPVVSAGNWGAIRVPDDELQDYIDDALDLIEFANGGTDTPWGAKRAALGHAASFNLQYIAIGNEEVGETFFTLYPRFHEAIRKCYPEIKIINSASPFAAGTEYERGWASARTHGSDYIDEHYYMAPEWFIANMGRYDSYDPAAPKVFLGEYASWGNKWRNALVEGAYMTHLERAPAVGMACYAPLLCHADYVNWRPDLIWFNSHQVCPTANYHVQKLFMNHQGDYTLHTEDEGIVVSAEASVDHNIGGNIILDAKKGHVQAQNVRVTCLDTGQVSHLGDFTAETDRPVPMGSIHSRHYSIEMTAIKTRIDPDDETLGAPSFRVMFGHACDENTFSWELGGWANGDSMARQLVNGAGSDWHHAMFSVAVGKNYELKLLVEGRMISTYIGGRLMNRIEATLPVMRPLYYTASIEEGSGDIIIKAVNLQESAMDCVIKLSDKSDFKGTLHQLAGHAPDDENDFANPNKITPTESPVRIISGELNASFPGRSISVLRLQKLNAK